MKRSTKIAALVAGAAAATAAAVVRFGGSTNDVPAAEEPTPDPVLEPGVDGAAFLDHLAAAVRIDTTVFEDRVRNDPEVMAAMHRLLETTYPAVHATCTREVVEEQSLLYTWAGSDPGAKPIVLMAHMDVVPVEAGTETEWTHAPFSGAVADGHLWGRGALDDKGSLIGILEAAEHLIDSGFEPRRTVYLVFGHDEEIGGAHGAANVAQILRDRGVEPWIVLDEGGGVADALPPLTDRPVAVVKVAEKGYLNVELTARGAGGHSSMPPSSTSAGILARAITALESNPVRARVGVLEGFFAALAPRLDPRMKAMLTNLRVTGPAVTAVLARNPQTDAMMRTSTAVTVIGGGMKPNVLPQESRAIVNFRIIPGDTTDSVLQHVRSVVGPDIEAEPFGEMRSEPSRFSSTDNEAWEIVSTTVRETFPEAVVAPWILTGATDSRYFLDIADEVYGFGPFTTDTGLNGIHGTDERLRVADADGAVSFFARFIRSATA